MHNSVKNCKIHHFVDVTNLLLTNSLLKIINRQVTHDLSLICHWLRANKISLNTIKTEIIIFRSKKKQITKHLNFKISGQKVNTCSNVKYLGITLEENLEWNLTSVHSNENYIELLIFSEKLETMYQNFY